MIFLKLKEMYNEDLMNIKEERKIKILENKFEIQRKNEFTEKEVQDFLKT